MNGLEKELRVFCYDFEESVRLFGLEFVLDVLAAHASLLFFELNSKYNIPVETLEFYAKSIISKRSSLKIEFY